MSSKYIRGERFSSLDELINWALYEYKPVYFEDRPQALNYLWIANQSKDMLKKRLPKLYKAERVS